MFDYISIVTTSLKGAEMPEAMADGQKEAGNCQAVEEGLNCLKKGGNHHFNLEIAFEEGTN